MVDDGRGDIQSLWASMVACLALLTGGVVVAVLTMVGVSPPAWARTTFVLAGTFAYPVFWRVVQGAMLGMRWAPFWLVPTCVLVFARPFGPDPASLWMVGAVAGSATAGWVVGGWWLHRTRTDARWRDRGHRRDVSFVTALDIGHIAVRRGIEGAARTVAPMSLAHTVAAACTFGAVVAGPDVFARAVWLLERRRDRAAAAEVAALFAQVCGTEPDRDELMRELYRAVNGRTEARATRDDATLWFALSAATAIETEHSGAAMMGQLPTPRIGAAIARWRARCPLPAPDAAQVARLAVAAADVGPECVQVTMAAHQRDTSLLVRLARSDAERVLFALAENPHAPAEALWLAAQSPYPAVAERLRGDDVWPRLPEEAQAILVLRGDA